MKEIRLLKANEIECRVGICKSNGFSLLLYKDARVDMNILDETFGSMNWQREHKEIKGNLYCGISIWDEEKQQWITKWDCGIESIGNDGNGKKGESSDSFKRAGFNVGIGRELYTAPFIWIKDGTKKTEKNGREIYVPIVNNIEVEKIEYNDNREISYLRLVDDIGNIIFDYGESKPSTKVIKTKDIKEQIEKEEIQSKDELTIEQAYECKTPKGTKLGDLSYEQLNTITKNVKYDEYTRLCAKMVRDDKDKYVRDENGEILF